MIFLRDNGQRLTEQEVAIAIKQFMDEKPHFEYKCYIGTDSQTFGRKIKYVTSVIIQRVTNGAIVFNVETIEKGDFIIPKKEKSKLGQILPIKIFREAELTLNMGRDIIDPLFLNNEIYLDHDVHFDVNTDDEAKTTAYAKSVSGMAKSRGYSDSSIVLKPYAFAAQTVANKYTKKL